MKRTQTFLFSITLILVLLIPALAHAQQWTGVLDPSRATNWSGAGVPGGIPSRTTICATLNPGATGAQINAAIAACPAGQTVFLNAGTYNISNGIVWNGTSNVTLRGAGANQTFLIFSSPDGCTGQSADVCMHSSDINWNGGPSNTANWTAGYAKGTTVITLSSTANLKVGNPLILDQLDDTSDTGNVFVSQNKPFVFEGPSGTSRDNRGQIQIVTVTAINGNQVTISPGLYMPNWRSSQQPGAWWATSPVQGDGIENISLDHTNSSALGGVMMFNCQGCWVKGIRSMAPGRSHTWLWASNHDTIRDSYFYSTQNSQSQSYGFEPYPASDVLVENNIYQKVAAPQTINGACSGCVVAYNFSINQWYSPSLNWQQQSIFMHSITDSMLMEGNVGVGIYSDLFHGTHNFHTLFRNRYDGFEANNGTTTAGPLNPVLNYPEARYYNIIGNVLGTAGVQTVYSVGPASSGSQDTSIFVLGPAVSDSSTGVNVPADPLVSSTLMRWGNYDTVNNAVRFVSTEVPSGLSQFANPVPGSQALPASFYLSAKPSWFGTIPWPPIGPDVTGGNIAGVAGHANVIPAQLCYSNFMGGPANGVGNVLTFNANTCYNTVGAQAPAPPTNVRAVAQ